MADAQASIVNVAILDQRSAASAVVAAMIKKDKVPLTLKERMEVSRCCGSITSCLLSSLQSAGTKNIKYQKKSNHATLWLFP